MMKKCAVLGDNCVDLYSDTGQWYLTGNAVDTAVHMADLGCGVALLTVVADDVYGDAMLDLFRSKGIDQSHVRRAAGRTAVTRMHMDGNDRVHGDYDEGVLAGLAFSADDVRFACGHDCVHSAFWGKAEQALAAIRRECPQTCISFDFADRLGDPKVAQLDGIVDIGFFSAEQDDPAIRDFLASRTARGMRIAVATFGEQGSLAFDGKTFVKQGIVPAAVVNTVGAGDSFIAGFLCSYLRAEDLALNLASGAKIAAQVVSQFEPF